MRILCPSTLLGFLRKVTKKGENRTVFQLNAKTKSPSLSIFDLESVRPIALTHSHKNFECVLGKGIDLAGSLKLKQGGQ